METFSALLALCAGNSPVTGEFSTQRPVTRSFDVFFDIGAWINGWVNNPEAGDLRRNRTHYDVIVMIAPVAVNHPQMIHCHLGQYYHCLSSSEVTFKITDIIGLYLSTENCNKDHNSP